MAEKILMKGNEAMAEAALRSGCRFFSGYPITPQTEILEYLSWRMEEVGGVFVQTESELAGVYMLLGASAAGARCLTSSSGPGFTLKQEGISYLCSLNLPAVLIDVMRLGSGLGDISQGQGDYWQLTRGGGHGDYRTIVLAPASVQEGADFMSLAFALSEKYQHPVIIGSDAAIGQMMESVEIPDFDNSHNIDQYDWSVKGCKGQDKHKNLQNEFYSDRDFPEKLKKKYDEIEENEQRWESIETSDAEIILVAYGCSSRICMEAVEVARAKGIKLGLIRPITLWPFPKKAFENLPNAKAFISVEMNILGQMVEDVKLTLNGKYPVEHFGTFFEVPDTDDIIARVVELENSL